MKVLICEPGKYAREAEIDGSLESEQAIVGGMIETVYPWDDSAILVCNDNGLNERLPLCRQINEYTVIAGTFFICGDGDCCFASLSDEQLARYKQEFYKPELFFPAPGTELGIAAVTCTPRQYRYMMGLPEPPKQGQNHNR